MDGRDSEYMSITSENLSDVETLDKNAETYIYGYFEDIKRKVDLRREDLIERIHNYSDEIIKSIENTQSECLKMSKEVNQLTVEIEKSKRNLNKLTSNFNTVEKRRGSLIVLNENFTKVLGEYNDSLLGFNKYSFDFKEINIKDVFGYFSSTKEKFDSTILDTDQQNQLINICEFPPSQKWELKYRASRDGFKASDFHSHSDGISNTLTVIKAKSGNIFGGFTEQEWHSRSEWITDPKAFIFSLVNKEEKPFKVPCSNGGQKAIGCNSKNGPCFGGEGTIVKDINIQSDSNINKNSYSNFGYSYQHPDYLKETDKAMNILTGSKYFGTLEIEVYAKFNC